MMFHTTLYDIVKANCAHKCVIRVAMHYLNYIAHKLHV